MRRARTFLVLLIIVGAVRGASAAEDHRGCLSPEQRRAAIAARQAMPLTKAVRVAGSHLKGDIIKARLCARGSGLVYVLTVLASDGKVTRASLDGASGTILSER